MATTILRIPSKVPYGYVEIHLEGELDAVTLANKYAEYVLTYKKAEEAALQAPTVLKSKPAPVEEISKILEEDEAVDLVTSTLGATDVTDEPWTDENKPEPAAKEWEAPVDSDWDFG